MHRTASAAMSLLALALTGGPALGHAFLDHASPRVGSRTATAPTEVQLSFSEPLAVGACAVTVAGPPGFGGAGSPKSAPGDKRTLITPLRGSTPPGRYAVHWRVVSADRHVTQGDFRFEVTR